MTPSDWAAWVQAFGSIAAIGVAIKTSSKQFKDATTLQRQSIRAERLRRYEALTGLVGAALEDFDDTLRALRGSEPERWFEENSTREIMEEFYQAFRQISPLEMPSSISARSLVKLRDRIHTASWNANAAIEHGTGNYEDYLKCVEAMEHNLGEVREEQRRLLDELALARNSSGDD